MNDLHLDTDEAANFSGRLKNPPQVGAAPAQSCGSGMPECATLRSALDDFLRDATAFLQQVDQGCNGYRDVVNACRLDYDDTDFSNAQRIAQTMQVQPGDLAPGLRSRGSTAN